MEVNINEENVNRMKRSYRNKERKKKKRIIIVAILVVLLIIGIILLKTRKSDINDTNSGIEEPIQETIIGRWTTDGNTVYEFEKDGKGAIIVPVATLPFSYVIEDNTINVDIENEESQDISYTYELKEDKLILTSVNGTFEFIRVTE